MWRRGLLIGESVSHVNIFVHWHHVNTENGLIYSIKDFLCLNGFLYDMKVE